MGNLNKDINIEQNIGDGYYIKKADNNLYKHYYALYKGISKSTKYSFNLQNWYDEIGDNSNLYWIYKGDIKIGGVFLEANYLELHFLIPPYVDMLYILKKLYKFVVSCSDRTQNIYAWVTEEELPHYQKIGFQIEEVHCELIRPTEDYFVDINDKFEVRNLNKDNVYETSVAMYEAFKSSIIQTELQNHIDQVEHCLQQHSDYPLLKEASCVLYHKTKNMVMGMCLVSIHQNCPLINDLGVIPEYQNQGFAKQMVQRAISVLKKEYPYVKLYIDKGNYAESLYYEMGFLPARPFYKMYNKI